MRAEGCRQTLHAEYIPRMDPVKEVGNVRVWLAPVTGNAGEVVGVRRHKRVGILVEIGGGYLPGIQLYEDGAGLAVAASVKGSPLRPRSLDDPTLMG